MNTTYRTVLIVDPNLDWLRSPRQFADLLGPQTRILHAASVKEALPVLNQRPGVDVLVSELSLPDMDGLEFLRFVLRSHPATVRIVHSQHGEFSRMLESTHLAHQFLLKPCELNQLCEKIERTCRLREMLTNPQLLRLTTSTVQLPSVPALYTRLMKELQSVEPNARNVGDIIAQDAAMSAKILQLVNSAFFSLPNNITNPQRAVTILGINTIKALVLGVKIFEEYKHFHVRAFSMDNLWHHSLTVSSLSRMYAARLGLSAQEQENAQVAGLLHDIGRLLELRIPEFFNRVKVANGLVSVASEYNLLGTSHAELGAYLLGIWGLPDPIVEAIAYHHSLPLLGNPKPSVPVALHLANGLHNWLAAPNRVDYPQFLDMKFVSRGEYAADLDEYIELAKQLTQDTAFPLRDEDSR